MIGVRILPLAQVAEGFNSALISFGAHCAISGGLFFGAQKLFEEIEKKLSDDTRLEIAIWLLDLNPSTAIESWRSTSLKIFNLIFGAKHLSWKCFWRSFIATAVVTLIVMLVRSALSPLPRNLSDEAKAFILLFFSGVLGSVLPDYVSLWKTRYLLNLAQRAKGLRVSFLFLFVDVVASIGLSLCAAFIGTACLAWMGRAIASGVFLTVNRTAAIAWSALWASFFSKQVWAIATVWFIPAFFGRLWIISYVGCGLLVKGGRRLDIGFSWFNKRFDIEMKPLQSIGLVFGVLMVIGYWILVAVHVAP